MKRISVWFMVLTSLLFFVACDNSTPTADTGDSEIQDGDNEEGATLQVLYKKSDEKAKAVDNALLKGNSEFAVNIFKALLTDDADKNIFISPLSISVALSMTMNGTAGETFDGMQEALEFEGMTQEEINTSFLALLESLECSDKDVILTLANSIWLDPGYRPNIKQTFIDDVQTWYLSEVYDATSPDDVNAWIKEKTGGKIKDMIKEFPTDFVMYLINAIYFKGAWTTTFNKDDTYTTPFTKSDETTVDVEMMAFTEVADYTAYSDENVVGIRLPYGRGKIALYAFAAQDYGEGSVDAFIENLDGEKLTTILSSFREQELGGVHLPKFKIEYEKEINDILKSFGMERAYKTGFDKMVDPSNGNPHISNVKHKAFIEITEEGTEAAAATVVTIVDESMPTTFRANRPCFFVICDDRNGSILFMGKVIDPSL
jgi:serpin B